MGAMGISIPEAIRLGHKPGVASLRCLRGELTGSGRKSCPTGGSRIHPKFWFPRSAVVGGFGLNIRLFHDRTSPLWRCQLHCIAGRFLSMYFGCRIVLAVYILGG
jgi:hypothetical protein